MDKRLLEVMSEILIEVQHFKKDTNKRFNSLEERFEKVEKQQIKANDRLNKVATGLNEVRLSVMKLSDKIEKVNILDKRLKRVEKIVLK